jgi:hypothetical protein
MGNRYVVARQNITPTAANDVFQFLSLASRRMRMIQVSIGGLGSSSAAQQFLLGRATGGTTPGGPIVPDKFEHNDQPAAVTVVNTTWSAQPTMGTNYVVLGWNALGGSIIWNAPAGGNKFEARNAEFLSLRALTSGVTYQACSVSAIFEED